MAKYSLRILKISLLCLCMTFAFVANEHTTNAEPVVSVSNDGEVFFVLSESTNIFNAMDLIKTMDLRVKELNGFHVEIAAPQSRIPEIQNLLRTKSYLMAESSLYEDQVREPIVTYLEGKIIVALTFFNVGAKELGDFTAFMNANNLKMSEGGKLPYKWGLASAAVGTEDALAQKLKVHPLVAIAKKNQLVAE